MFFSFASVLWFANQVFIQEEVVQLSCLVYVDLDEESRLGESERAALFALLDEGRFVVHVVVGK